MKKICILLSVHFVLTQSLFAHPTQPEGFIQSSIDQANLESWEMIDEEKEALGAYQLKKGPLAEHADELIQNGRLHYLKLYNNEIEAPSALELVKGILETKYKELAFNIWGEWTPSSLTRWALSGITRMLTHKKDRDEERMEYLSRIITVSWWIHSIASEKRFFYDIVFSKNFQIEKAASMALSCSYPLDLNVL